MTVGSNLLFTESGLSFNSFISVPVLSGTVHFYILAYNKQLINLLLCVHKPLNSFTFAQYL